MRRVSILIAAVLACAIFSASPAMAQEARAAAPAAVQVAVPVGGGMHQNWFTDYNACIWGIGVPAGVAIYFERVPTWRQVAVLSRIPWLHGYASRVAAACGRFIRS